MPIFKSTKEKQTVVEEFSYKSLDVKVWLVIFQISSDRVWVITLYVLNYFVTLECLYMAVNNKCLEHKFEYVNYVADGLYLIDLVILGLEKLVSNTQVTRLLIARRPVWIVFCDLLSLIPQAMFSSGTSMRYCLLRVNRALRIVRVGYISYQSYKVLSRSIILYVVEFLLMCVLSGVCVYSAYCNIVCSSEPCRNSACDTTAFAQDLLSEMKNIVLRPMEDIIYYKLFVSLQMMCMVMLCHFFRAYICISMIQKSRYQHSYIYRFHVMNYRDKKLSVPDYLRRSSESAFKMFWVNCNGYQNNKRSLAILTPVMRNEILIDISWPAFKHSRFFRGMDLPFLRCISMLMSQQFFLPGEIIYRKNHLKDKMIYVVSGTIVLMSEEDGESPIISLTSGTIIGESNLYLFSKATNFVKCKTFCELHILNKTDYLKVNSIFPKQVTILRELIAQRLRFARESTEMVSHVKRKLLGVQREIDVFTIVWLKNILHGLLVKDADSAYRHEFQNIYLLTEIKQSSLKYLLFSAMNLDLLAICERLDTNRDANFARLKFPYILHSTSVIVYAWEFVIVCFAIFFSFATPYMIFVSVSSPAWYIPAVVLGTIFFAADIFIQVSTTVKTHTGVLATVSSIAAARFQTVGFWIDIFSCFPMEVFSSIMVLRLYDNSKAVMHLNRVSKVWRIQRLFGIWARSFDSNRYVIAFIKYTWLLSYIAFSIFIYLRWKNPYHAVNHLMFITANWISGMDFKETGPAHVVDFTIKVLMGEFMLLVILAFYATVSYIHVIQNVDVLEVQQVSFDALSVVNALRAKSLHRRVMEFLMTQWDANLCYYLQISSELGQAYLSDMITSETSDFLIGDYIRRMQFFNCFSSDMTLALIPKIVILNHPPGEVITYFGSITNSIYILYKGSCSVLDNEGLIIRTISRMSQINLVETALHVPNATTWRTETHCKLLKIEWKIFMRTLFEYQNDWRFFNLFLTSCHDIKSKLIDMVNVPIQDLGSFYIEKKSFIFFDYKMKMDSLEEFDFYNPFDRLYPCSFLRYFFLRCTFLPDGRFLFVWEIVRSILAITSILLYYTPLLVTRYHWILNALDFLGLVDIYIRIHVCYYTDIGNVVSHPLKTAKYYMEHGFAIDLISILPLRHLFLVTYDWTVCLINSNHILQLRRYVQFLIRVRTNMIKPISKIYSVLYVPFLVILCNTSAFLFFTMECTLNSNSIQDSNDFFGFTCSNDSLMTKLLNHEGVSLTRAHFYYLYVTTPMFTGISYQGFPIDTDRIRIFMSCCIMAGLYMGVVLVGHMQQFHCFRRAALLESQIAMKHLKSFLKFTIKDWRLKEVVIKACELKWTRKGQGISEVILPFNLALRTDILYEYYGKFLHSKSPFQSRSDAFYKNMLTLMKFDLIRKDGYLQTINDVQDNIYFLFNGMADVLAADGTTLETLHSGSIYGNISDEFLNRLKISIIATTHVEILICKSEKFMKLMSYYSSLRKEFIDLRIKYVYYIPSKVVGETLKDDEMTYEKDASIFTKVFDPHSFLIRLWSFLHLIGSCYIGIILDVYQIGSCDYSSIIITLQYVCDLLYLVQFILKDRIAYENEWGRMVEDITKIQKRNRKKKLSLYLTLISLIPADVLAYSLKMNEMTKRRLYSILRLNRFLRISYLVEYMQERANRLDVNIFLIKMVNIVLWSFLVVSVYAAIIAVVSCTFSPNLHPHVPKCEVFHNMSSEQTFRQFLLFYFTAWDAFSNSKNAVYAPIGTLHVILFTLTMISGYYTFYMVSCEVFSLTNEINIQRSQYILLFDNIKYYLYSQNVSASLRLRCFYFLESLWTNNGGEVFPKLLTDISPYLKDAAMNCAFGVYVTSHPIFAKCHGDCLRQIVQQLQYHTYNMDEFVQFTGTIDQCMYFVYRGEIDVLVDEYLHNDVIVVVLNQGDSFGVPQGLLKMEPHKYSYKCRTQTIILSLHLPDWKYLLDFFPASKEIIYDELVKYTGL